MRNPFVRAYPSDLYESFRIRMPTWLGEILQQGNDVVALLRDASG
jgi:hypothetical protein